MTLQELPVHTEFIWEAGQYSHHVSIKGSEGSIVPKFGSQQLTKTGFNFFTRRIRCSPQVCPVCLNPENYEGDCMPAERVVCTSKPFCLGCEIIAWALEPYKGWLKELKELGERKGIMVNGLPYLKSHHGGYLCGGGNPRTTLIDVLIRSKPCQPTEGVSPELTNSPCPWNFPRIGPEITGHTGSSAAIDKARTWYSECLVNHKRCLQNSGSPLPTRIILIEGTAKARLHTSSTEHAPYACLSHCWGGQSVIQTTTRTLEQFTTNLPWEELPQTFKDAIQFVHGFGFKYLWIDSLCIVQDSIDDWRHEGSRMSQIYANASVTLSSTWAENPSQGCFATSDKKYVSRTRTFRNADYETYELHCHEQLPSIYVGVTPDETPLLNRGWVFQERMLSNRIVHFMRQELWWECRESLTCECRRKSHTEATHIFDMGQIARMNEFCSFDAIEGNWEHLVRIYTKKSLTYSSDIFPALQGLAKLVSPSMGKYLAGHWESTLTQSLCWHAMRTAQKKPQPWRAPSWSWAAAKGEVIWPLYERGRKIQTCAKILGAMTRPKGDDPMGEISYGVIYLKGRYLVGQIQDTRTSEEHLPSSLTLKGSRPCISPKSFICYPSWDSLDHEDGAQIVALKMLEVASLSSCGRKTSVEQYWLILRAIKGVQGKYMRIGIMEELGAEKIGSRLRDLNALYEEESVEMDFKIV